MYLHNPLKKVKFYFGLILLLALWGCSSHSLSEKPDTQMEPAIVPRLNSPLLGQVKKITKTENIKNHVRIIDIGYDALLLRIHLIRSARHSISIQTMIWVNDETGRLFIFELIQAARRGVKVQLLIDHLASEQDTEIAGFLAHVHPNFQIKLFNPITGFFGKVNAEPSALDKLYAIFFSFNRLNQRMHNKTFIVDDSVGITGGRNYQNAYYDQALGMNYKDRDIMIIGPVTHEMRASFDSYWKFERSINLKNMKDVIKFNKKGLKADYNTRESFHLNGLFDDIDRDTKNPDLISQLFVDSLSEVAHAHFIADDPEKTQLNANYSKITSELAELVMQANHSVYIQTPYLVLTSTAIDLFKNLRTEYPEIDIRISTNSLAATDSWYVYALSYKQKKTYLRTLNFKIFEFKPLPGDLLTFVPEYAQLKTRALDFAAANIQRQEIVDNFVSDNNSIPDQDPFLPKLPYLCLHAKSLVVDGEISFIGSYNLDPRSENINTESGLVIRDKNFSRKLQKLIKIDMEPRNAWIIAPKKRPLPLKITNSIFTELSQLLPLVDIWPFRYSASFELVAGKQNVDTNHADFYKNFKDVGSFPQAGNEGFGKEVGARGVKAFFSFVKPLL